jgi:hypothetical protein
MLPATLIFILLVIGGTAQQPSVFAALSGIIPWLPTVEKKGMILAAPLSERGWMSIGNSILLSTLSWAWRFSPNHSIATFSCRYPNTNPITRSFRSPPC